MDILPFAIASRVGRRLLTGIAFTIALHTVHDTVAAQSADDSSGSWWRDRISIDASGASWYIPGGAFREYASPEYLEPRRREKTSLQSAWRLGRNEVTDNPLIHVATSTTLGL